jgi:hypothetical protein
MTMSMGPYREWLSTTRLPPIAYNTKHSHSNVLIHRGGKQGILVRGFVMQLVSSKLLHVNAQS